MQARRYVASRRDAYDSASGKYEVDLPSIEGFALYLKVSRDTLYAWKRESHDVADALDYIKMEQRKRLINKGLGGKYNAAIVKLILVNNHEMREKAEEKQGSKDKLAGSFFGSEERMEQVYRKADELGKQGPRRDPDLID